jgi:hypothetical protein
LESSNFIQRLYGNGKGRAFQGAPDGQADRIMDRTSPVEYAVDERAFYRYPFDLGDSPEHQNFIVIDIFENKGHGLNGEHSKKPFFGSKFESVNNTVQQAASKLGAAKTLVPEALAISGLIGGKKFLEGTAGKVLKGTNLVTSGIAKDTLGQVIKAGQQNLNDLGKGEEGFVQEALGIAGSMKRANKTICLYMPGGVKSSYNTQYTDADFTKIGQMSTMVQGGLKNLASMATNGGLDDTTKAASEAISKQMAMGVVKELGEKLDEIGDNMGLEGKTNLEALVQAGQNRKARNPFVLQLFESVDRRNFEYNFEFIPKSKKEVNEIYAIIRTLKRYSLPSRALGGRFLDFPAEFRLTYVNTDKENLYLYRIARCALVGIDVDYGTNPFTTFKPDEGGAAPTQIKLSLKFNELEILTQERVDQGF